ncbi:TetR/AcrR family transcriptional regulator [Hoyosella subflava]|uniref:TetR/AcrR family transcriptional regulator n=1 Tax=Hoyosella subflava TaxID=639313 RepID=UPI00059B88AE|nr:TetR/AcrR family transcriptional regulator [Hoyosella subflava]
MTASGSDPARRLPLIGAPESERADAVRNRERLLCSARQIVRTEGAEALTMERLAHSAGVGKGTVFRRFGSRSGLMFALLDEAEQQLQHAYLFGPPPLGPGAAPVDRLLAYGRARLTFLDEHGELQLQAERQPMSAYRSPPHAVEHTHVMNLLIQARVTINPRLLADSLLASLTAGLVLYQLRTQQFSLDDLVMTWEHLVRATVPRAD